MRYTKAINVKIEKNMHRDIRRLARSMGLDMSKTVRVLIEDAIRRRTSKARRVKHK